VSGVSIHNPEPEPPNLKRPKVSVCIPSYNCARYLPEAIESVLEQEFRDFELLIIDDASTDGSRAIIEKYAALDCRVAVQSNPVNLGAVPNWNRCLAQAKGDYVKFLCCDDTLATAQALGKLAGLLEASPSAVLAASARNIIDEHSRVMEVCDALAAPGLGSGHEVVARCLEQNTNLIGEPSAVMFRRRNADRGFDERYRQIVDMEMWFHLLEQGDIVYTSQPLCSFRRHSQQLTAFNRANRLGVLEQTMLLNDYFLRPWLRQRLSPKALFIQSYYLRKGPGKRPASATIEQQMLERLGWWRYAALWLRHKAITPCFRLQRFLQERIRIKSPKLPRIPTNGC